MSRQKSNTHPAEILSKLELKAIKCSFRNCDSITVLTNYKKILLNVPDHLSNNITNFLEMGYCYKCMHHILPDHYTEQRKLYSKKY